MAVLKAIGHPFCYTTDPNQISGMSSTLTFMDGYLHTHLRYQDGNHINHVPQLYRMPPNTIFLQECADRGFGDQEWTRIESEWATNITQRTRQDVPMRSADIPRAFISSSAIQRLEIPSDAKGEIPKGFWPAWVLFPFIMPQL